MCILSFWGIILALALTSLRRSRFALIGMKRSMFLGMFWGGIQAASRVPTPACVFLAFCTALRGIFVVILLMQKRAASGLPSTITMFYI